MNNQVDVRESLKVRRYNGYERAVQVIRQHGGVDMLYCNPRYPSVEILADLNNALFLLRVPYCTVKHDDRQGFEDAQMAAQADLQVILQDPDWSAWLLEDLPEADHVPKQSA